MIRRFTIVGLGEALLVEYPDRNEAAGIAALVALRSAWLGHAGVAVTRIGQDPQAETLLEILVAGGVDTSHMQTDPDLPTGRSIVRAMGGRIDRYLEGRAAFDNLQSDFDLEDVAQQADAVVFGVLTRRGGQTRSEENRFLSACDAALKVFDLTNRTDGEIDRGQISSGLELADVVVADPTAIAAIRRGTSEVHRDVVLDVIRDAGLAFLVMTTPPGGDDGARADSDVHQLALHTESEVVTADIPAGRAALAVALVVVLESVLRGRALADAIERAARASVYATANPGEPVPEGLRD